MISNKISRQKDELYSVFWMDGIEKGDLLDSMGGFFCFDPNCHNYQERSVDVVA